MAEMSINSVVMSIMAVAIGMIMIGNLLIPIAINTIDGIDDSLSETDANGNTVTKSYGKAWSTLMTVVVLISIIGLVIVAINNYTKR